MANGLSLSDSNYWASNNIAVYHNVKWYTHDSLQYEAQGGRYQAVFEWGNNTSGYKEFTVTFPRSFSATPIVVITDSRDDESYQRGHYSCMIVRDSVTTTQFKWRYYRDRAHTGGTSNTYITWIALVPKQTLGNADQVSRGTFTATPIGTGSQSIKLTDNNFWMLESINDTKSTAKVTLHDTYLTWESGLFTVNVGANSGVTKTITYSKVYPITANVIACVYSEGGSGGVSRSAGNSAGYWNVSAASVADGTAGATLNKHTQARFRVNNASGTARTITVNWIAFGLAEK